MRVARLAGRVDASRFLNAVLRQEMQTAFGLDRPSAAAVARDYASTRYTDYVIQRRIWTGREDPETWRVVEKNAVVVDQLRASGASFVVATGHFTRHASYALYTGMTIPHHIVCVTLPSRIDSSPSTLRSRLNLFHKATMLDLWERMSDLELATVDDHMMATSVVRRLIKPGTAVLISTDAFVETNGQILHQRPFAAWGGRSFALGTARIARTARCPVVVCHPYVEADETVVLEWAGPFTSDTEGVEGDIEVTDGILDELERMVGRRPTQYVYPIGGERTWEPAVERWLTP
jgi:lauroyl/myristoyl acyltransferase